LERFPQSRHGRQRFATVGDCRFDNGVVHAADFIAPSLVELFGALFYGELVVTADESRR
jgi:hypothetical protein